MTGTRHRLGIVLPLMVGLLAAVPSQIPAMPGDPDWLFESPEERRGIEQAESQINRFEYDDALRIADEAVSRFPQATKSHLIRIRVLHSMNRLQDALPVYLERTARDPKDGLAHLCLAACYYGIRNIGSAQAEIQEARRLLPKNVEARHIEAMIARVHPRRRADADSLAERLRNDHPDYAAAYVSEAAWLLQSGAPAARIQPLLDAALTLPAPPADAFDLLDRLRRRDDFWYDSTTALPLYDQALRVDPSRVDLALARVYRLRQIGSTEAALESLLGLIREAPRAGEVRLVTARLLLDLQRHDEALDVLADGLDRASYQDWYPPRALRRRADAFHLAGRDDEAAAELQRLIREHPALPGAQEARQRAITLLGRDPDARVHILKNVPFLAQRGNYCGPATLSMAMGYWGVHRDQNAVGRDIYTGVVGTAAQVVHEYCREHGFRAASFEGSIESWKRLLDAGVPILWLTKLPKGSGHYILIVGYDDVLQEFVVHNPHEATERRAPYSHLKQSRSLLPNLTRSIALVPEGRPEAAALDGLKTSLRLRAINLAFYLATGSNLFKGLWPALAVNLIVALGLSLLLLLLMRGMTYPSFGFTGIAFVILVLSMIGALNYLIAASRVSQAVSALVGFYLAWITLVPLYAVCLALRWLSHDWFRPREMFGLAAVVFGSWAIRGVIDEGYWADRVPLAIILIGFLTTLALRIRLGWAIQRARLGPTALDPAATGIRRVTPESLLGPYAKPHSRLGGYYIAEMALAETRLSALDLDGARECIQRIRSSKSDWSAKARRTFDLIEAAAGVLETASNPRCDSPGASREATLALLERLVAESRPATATGELARAFLAFCTISDPEFASLPDEERARAAAFVRETDAWFASRRSWPRLPAVPRSGFSPYPHLLIRLAPLLLARAAETLTRTGSGKTATEANRIRPLNSSAERLLG